MSRTPPETTAIGPFVITEHTPTEKLIAEVEPVMRQFNGNKRPKLRGQPTDPGARLLRDLELGRVLLRHHPRRQRLSADDKAALAGQGVLDPDACMQLARRFTDYRGLVKALVETVDPDSVQPVQPLPVQPVQPCDTEPVTATEPERRTERIVRSDGKTYPRQSDPELPHRVRSLREAGWTIREISRELGCSVGTVHRYLG